MTRQVEPAWFFDSSNMMLFVTEDTDPMCLEMLLCMHYGRCRRVPFLMVNNALSEGRVWIPNTTVDSSPETQAILGSSLGNSIIASGALASNAMKTRRSVVGNTMASNAMASCSSNTGLTYERPAYDPPMCQPVSRQSSASLSSTASESGDERHARRHKQGITITGSAVSQILIAESPLGVLQIPYYSTEQLTTLERFAVQFMVGNEGMTISIRNGRIMIR